LNWKEVCTFLDSISNSKDDLFAEKLSDSLANYDPDIEYLAVQQNGKSVSVELFTNRERSILRG
jgi:hypothetical protein